MATPAITKPITLDDLRAVDGLDEYKGMEIVDGVWTAKHEEYGVSIGHGRFGFKLLRAIGDYAERTQSGEVYMAETIFILHVNEDGVRKMRKPDVAYVRKERVEPRDEAYYFLAPDLAVEILSPSDTPAVIYDKLSDYFQYGTRQVWLVDFRHARIMVYADDFSVATYESGDTVSGGDVLPGFTLDVSTFFEG